jgi:hypothetical protein
MFIDAEMTAERTGGTADGDSVAGEGTVRKTWSASIADPDGTPGGYSAVSASPSMPTIQQIALMAVLLVKMQFEKPEVPA